MITTPKNLFTLLGVRTLFEKVNCVVSAVILFFITITLVIGTGRLFYQLGTLFEPGSTPSNYLYIFSDVLTLFILVELSRSLVEYFTAQRLRLTFILDAAIVFVLRHIMIALFEHKLATAEIYALSVLIIALGALRIGSVLVYQQEKKMASQSGDKQ